MAVRKKKRGITVFSVLLLLVLMGIAAALALFRPKEDPAQTVTASIAAALPAQESGLAGIDKEIADARARCLSFKVDGPFSQTLRSASGREESSSSRSASKASSS